MDGHIRKALAIWILATGLIATPQSPASSAPAQKDDLQTNLQRLVDTRIREHLDRFGREVLREAAHATDHATRLFEAIKWVSGGWLAIVTLMVGYLIFLGFRELNLVRRSRDEASSASENARASAESAAGSATRAKEMEGEIEASRERWQKFDSTARNYAQKTAVADLPNLERRGVVGQPPEYPSAELIARFEEADAFVPLADRFGLIPGEELTGAYMKLGKYWRMLATSARLSPDSDEPLN